jgi:hypothetical protein
MHAATRCLAVNILACLLVTVLAGCSKSSSGSAATDAALPATAQPSSAASEVEGRAAAAMEPDSPCRLLTDAEVRGVFPGVKAGQPERSREEYGIKACQWSADGGRFVAEVWKAKGSTADNEIHGLVEGFIDPVNPSAANNVRYEPIGGVGEQAFAVIETQDAKRGILSDAALLVARKDNLILVLLSDDLAHRDRATALHALTDLGGAAAKRL